MKIHSLYLHNFRNYEKVELTFSSGINAITGENAQGKTNLLEALYFLSIGRSFRTAQLPELIRKGEKGFFIQADVSHEGYDSTIKISYDGQNRKLAIDGENFTSFSHLLGHFPAVLFAPEDLSLITGSPSHRRRFLDLLISKQDRLYLEELTRYHVAMKQRNALLRSANDRGISPFETLMDKAASYIYKRRHHMLFTLEGIATEELVSLTGNRDHLTLSYEASPSPLLPHLEKNRERDKKLQLTSMGPHRDELLLQVNSLPARKFGSEGQKRSLLMALRLAEKAGLQAPIFLLDDYNAHLDSARKELLEKKLEKVEQAFLTSSASPNKANKNFTIQFGKIS